MQISHQHAAQEESNFKQQQQNGLARRIQEEKEAKSE